MCSFVKQRFDEEMCHTDFQEEKHFYWKERIRKNSRFQTSFSESSKADATVIRRRIKPEKEGEDFT